MTTNATRVVLITGCSSGIGRATAELLLSRGHTVYATARRQSSVNELADALLRHGDRAYAARLDVTDPDTSSAVVAGILDRHGRIDALVNNAAFAQLAAVEELHLDALRRQLEVNLVGALDLIQRVLPAMRANGEGRIINVSSVVAHISTPLMGAYCASKAALNSLSESLRMELAPSGIHVVLVEPGAIATQFRANAAKTRAKSPHEGGSHYQSLYDQMLNTWRNRGERKAAGPITVARAIARAVEARRPRTRYRVTTVARLAPLLRGLIPDRLADALSLRTFGLGQQK